MACGEIDRFVEAVAAVEAQRRKALEIFEDRIALWEGMKDAYSFSSGMAAIATTFLATHEPGDEIIVRMWGRVEGTQRMVVDRDGKIFFPKFGSLYVAGKTFEEVKSFLRSKVSTIAEVSSDVTLGQMKGIRVSLIGEVRAPGWYNVSSLHTALQLLSMAGGVKDIGSLRRIEVRRGGKLAETIDLYDFLLKGETGSDTRLLSGDTVFVPVVGKLAGVGLAGRLLGWPRREAWVIGWLLQTKALIMIIFANILLDKALITQTLFTALLLMAVASTMLTVPAVTPMLKRLGAMLGRSS